MDNKIALTSPITFTRTVVVTKMSIRIIELNLFQSVSIMVSLFSEDDLLYDNKYFKLEGEDYNNWNQSDNYIIEYVNAKLALEA
jgi:hypothetical protein